MQISDMLGQTGGIESIARELGISTLDATRGAAALAPAILGGFKKQSQSSGRNGLGDLLGQLGGASLFDDVVSPQSTDVGRGDNVLGRIFGSKDVSRDIAENASAQTGLDQGLLKQMLPRLAMLVAGHMAKQSGAAASRGGLGVLLGGLGGRRDEAGEAAGLASMLDLGGDGNPLDDILQKVARARR
jgi:hypothetical protein